MSNLDFVRHAVQLLVLAALNGKLFGIASSKLIVPFLWPTQAPFSTAYGALESLEFTVARGVFPFLSLGVILLTGVLVGRVFCGWACPLGLVQDLLSYLPVTKKKQDDFMETFSFFKDLKYAVLLFIAMTSIMSGMQRDVIDYPVGVFSEAPFSVFDPSGTLFAYIPWLVMWKSSMLTQAGLYGAIKFAFFILTIGPSIFVPRFFCRNVCPMGAILEPLAPYKYLRISTRPKVSPAAVKKVLDEVCPMGLESLSDPGCIHCGRCVAEEPSVFQQVVF